MERLLPLGLVDGPSETELGWIKEFLTLAGRKLGAEAATERIVLEDLCASLESRTLREEPRIGYVLVFGETARRKAAAQLAKGRYVVRECPPARTWTVPDQRRKAGAEIAALLKSWKEFEAEKAVAAFAERSAASTEETVQAVEASLPQMERYLSMMLANGRNQALVFAFADGLEPTVELRDATKRLRAPLREVAPLLVEEATLADPAKLAEAVEGARKCGYERPFPLTIDGFLTFLRIACQLARSGRARIEVALSPEGETAA